LAALPHEFRYLLALLIEKGERSMTPMKALMKSHVAISLSFCLFISSVSPTSATARVQSVPFSATFTREAFVEPYSLTVLKPFHVLTGAYLRRQAMVAGVLSLPGFFSEHQSLRWNLLSALQSFSLSAPARFVSPPNIPNDFRHFLSEYDLHVNEVKIHRLKGTMNPKTFFESPLADLAVRVSVGQAVGCFQYAGIKAKEAADGNAVELGERQLFKYTEDHPDQAIAILGDEGAKDGSFSLKLMSVYYQGRRFISPNLKVLKEKLETLHRKGIHVHGFVGDALEATNNLVSSKAKDQSTDSWSLFGLFDSIYPLRAPSSYLPLVDDPDSRFLAWSYEAPEDAGVDPSDTPATALPKIAKAWAKYAAAQRKIPAGSPRYAVFEKEFINYFMNRVVLESLGDRPKELKKPKDPDIHRHQAMIDEARAMTRPFADPSAPYYPGMQVIDFPDGDAVPRIVASRGLSSDGKFRIVMGRTGSAEMMMAALSAETKHSHSPRRYVDQAATNEFLNAHTISLDRFPEEQIRKQFTDLGIPETVYKNVLRKTGQSGIVAATAVTGASEHVFGPRAANLLQRVKLAKNGDSHILETNTLVANRDGSTFVVRITFQSPDMMDSRRRIIAAHDRSLPHHPELRAQEIVKPDENGQYARSSAFALSLILALSAWSPLLPLAKYLFAGVLVAGLVSLGAVAFRLILQRDVRLLDVGSREFRLLLAAYFFDGIERNFRADGENRKEARRRYWEVTNFPRLLSWKIRLISVFRLANAHRLSQPLYLIQDEKYKGLYREYIKAGEQILRTIHPRRFERRAA
jgi:hypothetical protein